MPKKTHPTELRKSGKIVSCPICGCAQFQSRNALLNIRGMTFLNFDWANKKAKVYICDRCGHLLWFLED